MLLELSFSRASSQDSWNSRPKHTSGEHASVPHPACPEARRTISGAAPFGFKGAVLPVRQPRAYATVVIPSFSFRARVSPPRTSFHGMSFAAQESHQELSRVNKVGARDLLLPLGCGLRGLWVPHPSLSRLRVLPCASPALIPPLSSRAPKREGSAFAFGMLPARREGSAVRLAPRPDFVAQGARASRGESHLQDELSPLNRVGPWGFS